MSVGLPGVPVYSIDVVGYVAKFLPLSPQVSLDVDGDPLHVIADARGHLQVLVLSNQPLLRVPCPHILYACTHHCPNTISSIFSRILFSPMQPSEFLKLHPMLLKTLVSLGSASTVEAG